MSEPHRAFNAMYTTASPDAAAVPTPTTAAQVLEHHTQLHDLLAHPNPAVISIVSQFGEWADKRGGESQFTARMLHPFRESGSPGEAGWESKFLVHIAKGLLTATTYRVTAPMCEIAEALYEQTAEKSGHMDAADQPSECGFLWLDKPFRRADLDSQVMQCRAVTWSPQAIRHGAGLSPGVRITMWSDWGADPAAAEVLGGIEASGMARTLHLLGPLTMGFTCVVPFGVQHGSFASVPGSPAPLHFAHALWLLIDTEIAVTGRGHVERAARRRALRSIRHDEVTVVTLRRSGGIIPEGDDGHRLVDWSCRWLVRGFWRHLEGYEGARHEGQGDGRGHCQACGARATWVRPYVKGPDDRPLKASHKVFRLSR